MVDEPVDKGDGTPGVGEDGRPVGEGQIGGEGETFPLVPAADDLEEEVRGAGVIGEVAKLVKDQEPALAIVVEAPGQATGRTWLRRRGRPGSRT
jgi:hypothetical protein